MNFSEFLNTVPAFEDFSRQEIEMLEQAMTVRDFPDGHVFVQEGESADTLFLIVDGEVVVTRKRVEKLGSEFLARLGPGEMFGLLALIDRGARSATCTAEGPVRVAYLPRNAFELLFKGNARIGYHFQQLIARQLVHDTRAATATLLKKIAD